MDMTFSRNTFVLSSQRISSAAISIGFTEIENKCWSAFFDCTGHGIPGAFMSILGVTLLNETVIREKINEPHLILNRLREKIIEALGQKGIISEVRDGMDGAIISYDLIHKKLIYSGAYNPMYLIRDNKS